MQLQLWIAEKVKFLEYFAFLKQNYSRLRTQSSLSSLFWPWSDRKKQSCSQTVCATTGMMQMGQKHIWLGRAKGLYAICTQGRCWSVSLSVCLSASLSVFVSFVCFVCLSVCLLVVFFVSLCKCVCACLILSFSVCLSVCLFLFCLSVSLFLSFCLSACQSAAKHFCLSLSLFVCFCVCLFASLSLSSSVFLSVCLSSCTNLCLLVSLSFFLSLHQKFELYKLWRANCVRDNSGNLVQFPKFSNDTGIAAKLCDFSPWETNKQNKTKQRTVQFEQTVFFPFPHFSP